jgi:hypothetical protein
MRPSWRQRFFWIGFYLLCSSLMAGHTRILLLGDSHINGWYGGHLHRYMHLSRKVEIFSLGIGGAGSIHFTYPLRNFCCGYSVRHTLPTDSLPSGNLPPKKEGKSEVDQSVILPKYGGRLDSLVAVFQPHVVVVFLGSNQANNHEGLIRVIRKRRPQVPVIWLGPFRRLGLEGRLYGIKKVAKAFPEVYFIPTHDLAGHDTLTMFHLNGKQADKVAKKVSERMNPLLDSLLSNKDMPSSLGERAGSVPDPSGTNLELKVK